MTMKLHHLRTLRHAGGSARMVRLSPDGHYLASASAERSDGKATAPQVCVWTVETGECICALSAHRSRISGLSFDAQGALFATCGDENEFNDFHDRWDLECSEAKVWQIATRQCVATFACHRNASMGDVGFGPGGDFLITGTHHHVGGHYSSEYFHAEVGFWRIADAHRLQVHHADEYATNDVAVVRTSRDGTFVATLTTSHGTGGGELRTWSARRGFFSRDVTLRLQRRLAFSGEKGALAVDPDGQYVALSRGRNIAVLRASNLGVVRTLSTGEGTGIPEVLALAGSGRLLAVAPSYGALQILDTRHARALATIAMSATGHAWRDLAFDGRHFAAVGLDGERDRIDLWRVED